MADRPLPGQVTCPLCDKVCTIPAGGSDSLPNNLHALHMVELKKVLTERDNTITEHEKTICERDSTITTISYTNAKLNVTNSKLNKILENGQ